VPATLRDVARRAGVSVKTVSRVVNNQAEVSEDTRQRVLDAIAALGYRPSKLARGLVTQRTDTVGLILGDINNPFFPEFARGVLDVAEANGYDVFVCNSDGDWQREIRTMQSLIDHAVDGIIIFPTFELQNHLPMLAGQGKPIVAINRPLQYPGLSRIMIRSRLGARLAVTHLINKGHTAIGMIAGQAWPVERLERVQGYMEALRAHGLPVHREWIVSVPPVLEQGRQAALQLLSQYPEITALFTYNDLLALGAIRACQALGRRVPEDCAIVGFDNIPLADQVFPALTTVHVDKYGLGQLAMRRLIEMLAAPDGDFPPIHSDVELVVRQSA